jgi:potassium efflux system protein
MIGGVLALTLSASVKILCAVAAFLLRVWPLRHLDMVRHHLLERRIYQGAEIIVPNSQLVTEQVTNWMLSDRLRRIDLPVGVSYSAARQKVIEVLEAVASAHPGVLKSRPPWAWFLGYRDSSINFELRAWTDQYSAWYKIRSELAVAVFEAVHAAGMLFPFPQREVRLLHDSET